MNGLLLTLLNGLQLGMLVFLLAAGLTLIFGLMDILNLAHGAFFTLGAYIGLLIFRATGSFFGALLLGPVIPFVLGALLQYFVLQPLAERGRSSHLDLALLTFGLLFAVSGSLEYVFGSSFYGVPVPAAFSGRLQVLGVEYPAYRLLIIALGLAVAVALKLLIDSTLVGARLRAGVDNREMAIVMGIDIRLVFALVFGAGSALASFAGVLAAPVTGIYSQMGVSILVVTFVVVVIGGLGNVAGSFYGSIIVGMVDTLSQAYLPGAELFGIYALLIVVMIVRPEGMFGKTARVG